MRRRLAILIPILGLVALSAATAAAGVRVRIGVRPDSIPQCGAGHFIATAWNTGADSIRVRVAITLTFDDTQPLGPILGGLRLGPHEVRSHSVDFVVPPGAPPGPYAFTVRAVASDSTRDQSIAGFAIVPGPCPPGGDPLQLALLATIAASLELAPDQTTPVISKTWGGVKIRYLPARPKKPNP